jgi:hypothetical protein
MALSPRDQERLRKGREDAEKKMAAERRRIDRWQADQFRHETTVTGPDGVRVRLYSRPATDNPVNAVPGGFGGELFELAIALVLGVAYLLTLGWRKVARSSPRPDPQTVVVETSSFAARHIPVASDSAAVEKIE